MTTTIAARTFPALGTFATLLVADLGALAEAHDLLAAELEAMDAACSRFRHDSELWRDNHAHGEPVQVSRLFADALAVALDAAALQLTVDQVCADPDPGHGVPAVWRRTRPADARLRGGPAGPQRAQLLGAGAGRGAGPGGRGGPHGRLRRDPRVRARLGAAARVTRAWLLLGGVGLLLLLLSVVWRTSSPAPWFAR